MKEKTVETKQCKQCNLTFNITDKDLEFYDKISPVFEWKKYSIPVPEMCPDCRRQRRLSFWNQTKLYSRKCDATWKSIISIFSPDKVFKIYDYKYWWWDTWDAMDYWVNCDFSRSFFDQFNEIFIQVPQMNLYVAQNEDSDYVNWMWWSKSCYLCFSSDYSENSYYCSDAAYSNNCIDCTNSYSLTRSYNCLDCKDSFELFFSKNCENSNNSYFLQDCIWVNHCFASFWLQNKKYCIFNNTKKKNTKKW